MHGAGGLKQALYGPKCPWTISETNLSLKCLSVLQAFREDRTLLAAADFIAEALGQRFIESVPLNLERALVESAPNKPLICLLSPGRHLALAQTPSLSSAPTVNCLAALASGCSTCHTCLRNGGAMIECLPESARALSAPD